MPELPEVETIRRQIAPVVEGRKIEAAEVRDPRWVLPHTPAQFEQLVGERTIASVERRGKYFLFNLDDGAVLIMHLRMTGNLLYLEGEPDGERKHLRGEIWLSDGGSLVFVDPRRFGTAEVVESRAALDDYFATRLGPEPFSDEFDGAYLQRASRNRRTPVKAFLLDQRTVAGVGNIYADESLFRAGISPRKRAARLTRAECDLLAETVRDSLNAGIDAKGASIDDFRDAYGVQGSFQDQFLVHLREGLPCPQCGAPVQKIRCAGRGTYFCRNCQKG